MKSLLRGIAIVVCWCLCLSCAEESTDDRQQPAKAEAPEANPQRLTRIVLITIDTLRADHLSGYGYDKPTSPNIDKLMARGATFTRAFSASSNTGSSHASIMTGRYAPFHSIGAFNSAYQLTPETQTLAELLSEKGFWTGAVVSNPILDRGLGLSQGFHVYDDDLEGSERNRPYAERYADVAVDKGLWVIERFKGRPYFLWVHIQDPHGPYDPPKQWLAKMNGYRYERGRQLPAGQDHSGHRAIPRYQIFHDERAVGDYMKRYDAEIAFADSELGRLFELLGSDQQMYNSLVIVTSDHGEAFGEDDLYFAHGHSVGLDLVRVPLVLMGSGIPAGLKHDQPVSNAWIFDTVLHFVDGQSAGDRSLLTAVADDKDKSWDAPPAFMDSLNQAGVAQGDWFFRTDRLPPEATIFWTKDPNTPKFWEPLGKQWVSLVTLKATAEHQATALLLDAHLSAMLQWPQDFAGAKRQLTGKRQLEALRSLGYVE